MEHDAKHAGAEDIAGKVVQLAEVLAYQKGAVVSRTLIDRRKGTITVFAFDKGQGLSEHIAPFDALVYVLDGEGEVTISGKAFRVKKGEMLIMPANQPHVVRAPEKFKMLLVMIRS